MNTKNLVVVNATVLLAGIFIVSPCAARLVHTWTLGELTEKADVVVIAQAVSNRDTQTFDPHDGWGIRMGVKTRFDKLAVLKGKVEGDTLNVFHYRFAGPVHDANAPQLVKFSTRDPKGSPAIDYLLFLQRSTNGEFEPVSGQADPVYSVRKVNHLTDDDLYPAEFRE